MAKPPVKITLDGKILHVSQDARVIDIAEAQGIDIPRFCYHKNLSAPAVCRMCLVEVEGMPKLQPSCSLGVREGLVVQTRSEKVKRAVKEVLEFTLINHPLDCPVCDQAGECGLHDYYQDYGLYKTAFALPKVHKTKVQRIGPTLMLDAERCVLCTRCVRFTDEITKTHEMAILARGDHSEITAVKEVTNPYSTNLADICPVGALTQADFRFRQRVWLLKETSSICPGCSRGCNVTLDFNRDEVHRIRPRENVEVNQTWMCDDGRALYKRLKAPDRLKTPMLRKDGKLVEVSFPEAYAAALQLLEKHAKQTVFQGSAHASNEEAFALSILAKMMQAPAPAALRPSEGGWEDDTILRRADRTPNRFGASCFASSKDFQSLLKTAKVALIVREDAIPAPLGHLEGVIFVGTHKNATFEAATIVLPIAMWAEDTGSFTNFQGRTQAFFSITDPSETILPAWKLLSRLSLPFGGSEFKSAENAFDRLAKDFPPFFGLRFSLLAPSGFLSQKVLSPQEARG